MKIVNSRKIVFHIRPWEVGLYTGLETFFTENVEGGVECLYMTHNYEAEQLLRQKGRSCINITREAKKIPISSGWVDRLQEIENRCLGDTRNFVQYLIAERYLKNKPRLQQMKQLYRMAVFYDSLFDEHRPFFMLSNGPDHMAFWLAMDLLRHHGGHPCGLVPVSWPRDHFSMYRGVGEIYYGKKLYETYLERGLTAEERVHVEDIQTNFREGKTVPINISSERFSLIRRRDLKDWLHGRLCALYWQAIERLCRNWYVLSYPFPGTSLIERMQKWYAKVKTQTYFNEKLPSDVPFVFFPLHLEPEATTQLYSNYYENQLEVITALSKSLPISWKLAVKEHPNMRSGRSLSFLQRLSKLPNTVLISPGWPSWRLVQQCRLVATLSGTSGLEASIIGKPVLIFGDPAWGYSPTALKVRSLHELPTTIEQVAGMSLPQDEERVHAFILSWIKANPEGIHDYFPWLPPVDDPLNVQRIGSALVRLMKDIQNGYFP